MFSSNQLPICFLILLFAPQIICGQKRTFAPPTSTSDVELPCATLEGLEAHMKRQRHASQQKPPVCPAMRESISTPRIQARKFGELDSGERPDVDSLGAPVTKDEDVNNFFAEFTRDVTIPDVSEDSREEKLKLKPEIFFQGRYSFGPDRGDGLGGDSHFRLTQLELGWSGGITRHIGVGFELQLHSVINGEPRDVINDAFVEYYVSDHASVKAGQVTKPFGFDAQQSSAVRESPERAMFVGYFFPGEHDRGVVHSGNLDFLSRPSLKGVTYSFAVFSGNLFFSRAKSQFNYVARVRKVFDGGRLALGVSMQQGKQPLPEGLTGKSRKNIFGADLQYVTGRLGLRGEFAAGHTPSALVPAESVSSFRPGAHSAGGALFVSYRLTRQSSFYVRYDQFNGDPAVGQSIRALNFGYFRQVGKYSRLSFDYQVKNRRSFNDDAVNDRLQITWGMVF